MARLVRVIPATKQMFTGYDLSTCRRRKVAIYARVSTEYEEQMSSYEAQIEFFEKYVGENPDWDLVGIYSDEAKTGTTRRKRPGFNRMIADALAGEFDLIITKSISRFARNTLDTLECVRDLKAKGVEVFFQNNNLRTFDPHAEMTLTILASIAQEESRNISENIKWSVGKRYKQGIYSLPYASFLGYEKGKDGKPKIVEHEADIVRKIYSLFMTGKTPQQIANYLEEKEISSPQGKQKWQPSTIISILTNEKYMGDARLHKKFVVDFLEKKTKVNEGEVEQYYVDKDHEAIIPPSEFEWVQLEFARRKAIPRKYRGKSCLETKIVCADCGGFYGAKTWHSTDRFRKEIWQCNEKYRNKEKCNTPVVSEEEIKKKFVMVYNMLTYDKEELLDDCRLMQELASDCTELNKELKKLYAEMEMLAEYVKKLVNLNAMERLNQEEYSETYNEYVNRYDELSKKVESLEAEKKRREDKGILIGGMIFEITEYETPLLEFDEKLWMLVVEKVLIHRDGRLEFVFKNGVKIEI